MIGIVLDPVTLPLGVVYLHQRYCPACEGNQWVSVSRPGVSVGVVIDCPQCTDDRPLVRLVGMWDRGTPTTGGGAA